MSTLRQTNGEYEWRRAIDAAIDEEELKIGELCRRARPKEARFKMELDESHMLELRVSIYENCLNRKWTSLELKTLSSEEYDQQVNPVLEDWEKCGPQSTYPYRPQPSTPISPGDEAESETDDDKTVLYDHEAERLYGAKEEQMPKSPVAGKPEPPANKMQAPAGRTDDEPQQAVANYDGAVWGESPAWYADASPTRIESTSPRAKATTEAPSSAEPAGRSDEPKQVKVEATAKASSSVGFKAEGSSKQFQSRFKPNVGPLFSKFEIEHLESNLDWKDVVNMGIRRLGIKSKKTGEPLKLFDTAMRVLPNLGPNEQPINGRKGAGSGYNRFELINHIVGDNETFKEWLTEHLREGVELLEIRRHRGSSSGATELPGLVCRVKAKTIEEKDNEGKVIRHFIPACPSREFWVSIHIDVARELDPGMYIDFIRTVFWQAKQSYAAMFKAANAFGMGITMLEAHIGRGWESHRDHLENIAKRLIQRRYKVKKKERYHIIKLRCK